jgi:hypothetical protein
MGRKAHRCEIACYMQRIEPGLAEDLVSVPLALLGTVGCA